MTPPPNSDVLLQAGLAVIGTAFLLLLSGNLYFVRKLVEKIDKVEKAVQENLPGTQAKVDLMETKIADIRSDLQRIGNDFKDVSSLRERVAVLEFALKEKKGAIN